VIGRRREGWLDQFEFRDELQDEGGVGVREPTRPKPPAPADTIALPLPDN